MTRILGLQFVALILFAAPIDARALISLKSVEATGPNQVELVFDRDLNSRMIKTDFFRDIVQISLKNVSVYPAKIVSVKEGPLSKIFAYQYTPKLVRCRLTVDGKAENFKDGFKYKINGKKLLLSLSADSVEVAKEQESKVVAPLTGKANKKSPKELIDRIKSQKAKSEKAHDSGDLMNTFVWLAVFIAMAGVGFFVLRKLRGKLVDKKLIGKFLGRKSSSVGIEVLATHYLGPKKSIAVVKVENQTLVVGITDRSINLISEISGKQKKNEEWLESNMSLPEENASEIDSFSQVLSGNQNKPIVSRPESISKVTPSTNVRDQIRKRIEGLKSL